MSILASPVPVGATLYQIVFERPVTNGICTFCAHAGVGSFASVVAPELSLVSENAMDVMFTALAKLSLIGAGAITLNVGKVTVSVVRVIPPPGGRFKTPTEFVLPKLAMKLAGTVADRCVESVRVVGIAVPPVSGFMITVEVDPKFVPTTVIGVFAEFTRALVGDTLEIVGAWPLTVNGNEFVVFGFSVVSCTLTRATPPLERSAAVIVAVSCVALPKAVVRGLPFHITFELLVNPVPVTASGV